MTTTSVETRKGVSPFTTVSPLVGIDIDVENSVVLAYTSDVVEPVSNTTIEALQTHLAQNYPHLLDSNTSTVYEIDIDNDVEPFVW